MTQHVRRFECPDTPSLLPKFFSMQMFDQSSLFDGLSIIGAVKSDRSANLIARIQKIEAVLSHDFAPCPTNELYVARRPV